MQHIQIFNSSVKWEKTWSKSNILIEGDHGSRLEHTKPAHFWMVHLWRPRHGFQPVRLQHHLIHQHQDCHHCTFSSPSDHHQSAPYQSSASSFCPPVSSSQPSASIARLSVSCPGIQICWSVLTAQGMQSTWRSPTPCSVFQILFSIFCHSYSVFCILLLQAAPVVHMVAKVSFDRQSKQVPLHF